jgi:hypothetical protein
MPPSRRLTDVNHLHARTVTDPDDGSVAFYEAEHLPTTDCGRNLRPPGSREQHPPQPIVSADVGIIGPDWSARN